MKGGDFMSLTPLGRKVFKALLTGVALVLFVAAILMYSYVLRDHDVRLYKLEAKPEPTPVVLKVEVTATPSAKPTFKPAQKPVTPVPSQ